MDAHGSRIPEEEDGMVKRRIFDMGVNFPKINEQFSSPFRFEFPKPRFVCEVLGMKLYEDPCIPSGEVHVRDKVTGRLLGRIK